MKIRGYTLIEVLVALLIFAILATLVMGGLVSILSVRENQRQYVVKTLALQRFWAIIERDLTQIIQRPITNNLGVREAAIVVQQTPTTQLLTFTRAGHINPMMQARRSTLQRVRYELQGSQLIRQSWRVLDQVGNPIPQSQILISNIANLQWQFYDDNNRVYSVWPPINTIQKQLPRAIACQVTFNNRQQMRRLFILPERQIVLSQTTS